MPINLSTCLLKLVADERFASIKALAEKPSLFGIVGRTHTETWHSMFLAWLLDPSGSHGLGDFALRRFLLTLSSPDIQADEGENLEKIARIAALGKLSDAIVFPKEKERKEYLIEGGGRLDVFVQNITSDDQKEKCVLLIEQKVNAKIDKQQCSRYADWLWRKYPDSIKLVVMLAPDDSLGLSSLKTFGDPRWAAINYQTLHDLVLVPSLRSPIYNAQTKPFLEQYIEALRVTNGERKLAVTEEEKKLAGELYEMHKTAFDAIELALSGEVELNLSGRPINSLKLLVNGETVEGASVPDFYNAILEYLLQGNIPISEFLPFSTGTKRYLIAEKPLHPGGNPFRAPIEQGALFMEAHKSRAQALKDVVRFLRKIGYNVSEM